MLNGIDPSAQYFCKGDARRWLERFARQEPIRSLPFTKAVQDVVCLLYTSLHGGGFGMGNGKTDYGQSGGNGFPGIKRMFFIQKIGQGLSLIHI